MYFLIKKKKKKKKKLKEKSSPNIQRHRYENNFGLHVHGNIYASDNGTVLKIIICYGTAR